MIQAPRISLARLPTPLEPLDRLSEEIGTRIWIKRDDLTDMVASDRRFQGGNYADSGAFIYGIHAAKCAR